MGATPTSQRSSFEAKIVHRQAMLLQIETSGEKKEQPSAYLRHDGGRASDIFTAANQAPSCRAAYLKMPASPCSLRLASETEPLCPRVLMTTRQ